ncbi:tyrosine-type recombinase/integrase [Litorivicinus lipolyticus]|uniref:tyrosine-type recombinase/integrase n=1 Tax=Litorivicinus lipolyticus TaxID=418701 RepID=UPI003B5A7791
MARLNSRRLKQELDPGRYGDGNGLYLHVRYGGSRQWMLRTTIHGKRCDIGLGSAQLVKLEEAREKAFRLRKLARGGENPLQKKNAAKAIPNFAEAAERIWELKRPSWRNPKHAQQWINTLRDHVFPHIATRRIDSIQSSDILQVMTPIWLEKPETARRVYQRIAVVFDWAKASGYREGDSPMEGVRDVLPKQTAKPKHHTALDWRELPDFMIKLGKRPATSARALEFIILTAARSSEARMATWDEIDLTNQVWTIPGNRMKMGIEHRVPLSSEAIRILKNAAELRSQYLFPAHNLAKPMSDMVFAALMKRMGRQDLTTHGFRSTFRDWCSEQNQHSREAAELSLAHRIGNATERAYARSDLLEQRRALMQDWAEYAMGNTLRKEAI